MKKIDHSCKTYTNEKNDIGTIDRKEHKNQKV
jgi:hypothetical protein